MSKQLHEMSDEELLALDPSTLVEEQPPADEAPTEEEESQAAPEPVSYTHLTLPTILLV